MIYLQIETCKLQIDSAQSVCIMVLTSSLKLKRAPHRDAPQSFTRFTIKALVVNSFSFCFIRYANNFFPETNIIHELSASNAL